MMPSHSRPRFIRCITANAAASLRRSPSQVIRGRRERRSGNRGNEPRSARIYHVWLARLIDGLHRQWQRDKHVCAEPVDVIEDPNYVPPKGISFEVSDGPALRPWFDALVAKQQWREAVDGFNRIVKERGGTGTCAVLCARGEAYAYLMMPHAALADIRHGLRAASGAGVPLQQTVWTRFLLFAMLCSLGRFDQALDESSLAFRSPQVLRFVDTLHPHHPTHHLMTFACSRVPAEPKDPAVWKVIAQLSGSGLVRAGGQAYVAGVALHRAMQHGSTDRDVLIQAVCWQLAAANSNAPLSTAAPRTAADWTVLAARCHVHGACAVLEGTRTTVTTLQCAARVVELSRDDGRAWALLATVLGYCTDELPAVDSVRLEFHNERRLISAHQAAVTAHRLGMTDLFSTHVILGRYGSPLPRHDRAEHLTAALARGAMAPNVLAAALEFMVEFPDHTAFPNTVPLAPPFTWDFLMNGLRTIHQLDPAGLLIQIGMWLVRHTPADLLTTRTVAWCTTELLTARAALAGALSHIAAAALRLGGGRTATREWKWLARCMAREASASQASRCRDPVTVGSLSLSLRDVAAAAADHEPADSPDALELWQLLLSTMPAKQPVLLPSGLQMTKAHVQQRIAALERRRAEAAV